MTQPLRLTSNIFAVEVPEDASAIETHVVGGVQKIVFSSELQDPLRCGGDMICLPPGTWQIIGMAGSVTEGDLMTMHDLQHPQYKEWFINFVGRNSYYTNRVDSLRSLLASKGLEPKTTLIIEKVK